MPTLSMTAKGFKAPFNIHNGTSNRNITQKQCIKFAVAVGNSHFSRAFGRTATALALASYRAAAIRCVLDFGHNTLRIRAEYSQLESTEKINLSYWIGMTFTAIAADRILGVPRLTHATRQSGLRKVNPRSRSLADLVGEDQQHRWHVFEAKGRQTTPSATHRKDWKAQARTVRSINNTNVSTRSYCVGLLATPCSFEMVDPPPRRRDPVDLKIDSDDLGLGYYRPFVEFLQTDVRTMTRNKRTVFVRPITFDPIDNMSIYIGLENRHFSAAERRAEIPFSVKEYEDDTLYIGKDGVAVATSKGPCDL